jgi:hypothetical protein
MKTMALGVLALGAGLIFITPASATPLSPGMTNVALYQQSDVIEVRRRGKRFFRHGRRSHFGFGLAFPLALGLGYGLGHRYYYDDYYYRPECYGRWHRHKSGRLHCHGELIY